MKGGGWVGWEARHAAFHAAAAAAAPWQRPSEHACPLSMRPAWWDEAAAGLSKVGMGLAPACGTIRDGVGARREGEGWSACALRRRPGRQQWAPVGAPSCPVAGM